MEVVCYLQAAGVDGGPQPDGCVDGAPLGARLAVFEFRFAPYSNNRWRVYQATRRYL